MKTIFIIFSVFPVLTNGHSKKQDSLWMPFKIFIGAWTGVSEGQPGKGKYERTYEFTPKKRFIEIKNKSIKLPTFQRLSNG